LRRVGFRARSQRRQIQRLVDSNEVVRYGVRNAASFLKGGAMDRLDGDNRTSQPDLRGIHFRFGDGENLRMVYVSLGTKVFGQQQYRFTLYRRLPIS
jgi:hypothetical protein